MKWFVWRTRKWLTEKVKDEYLADLLDWLDFTDIPPTDFALGAALGVFLAFVPLLCGFTALVILLIGFTKKADGRAAAMTGAVLKPLSILYLDPTSWEFGRSVCESEWAKTHASWFAMPGVALLGFERYHVMGGAILGLLSTIPVFILVRVIWGIEAKIRANIVAKVVKKTEKVQKHLEEPEPPKPAIIRIPQTIWSKATGWIPTKAWKKYTGWVPFKAKVALVTVVVMELFLLKPIFKTACQEKLPPVIAQAMNAVDKEGKAIAGGVLTWNDGDYDLSIVRGRLRLGDVLVTSPKDPKKTLFSAKGIEVKFSPAALLQRRFVVEKIVLDAPLCSVANADGSSGGGGTGPVAGTAGQAQDWAGKLRDQLDQLKKRQDEQRKKDEEQKKKDEEDRKNGKKPQEVTEKPDSLAKAADRAKGGLPGQNEDLNARPRWVVKDVEITNLIVKQDDPSSPSFVFNTASVKELSEDRRLYGQQTTAHVDGAVRDAAGKPAGTINADLALDPPPIDNSAPPAWTFTAKLDNVNLAGCDGAFANKVPLRFEKGTARVSVDAKGHGLDGDLDASPKLTLKDVSAQARDSRPIAGMDSKKVAEEVTAASTPDGIALDDMKIQGTLLAPQIVVGDTLKQLVLQGAKAYAAKKAGEQLDKGIDKVADKLGAKVPGLGDKKDDVKKTVGGALGGLGNGLFGSDDKKKDGN